MMASKVTVVMLTNGQAIISLESAEDLQERLGMGHAAKGSLVRVEVAWMDYRQEGGEPWTGAAFISPKAVAGIWERPS